MSDSWKNSYNKPGDSFFLYLLKHQTPPGAEPVVELAGDMADEMMAGIGRVLGSLGDEEAEIAPAIALALGAITHALSRVAAETSGMPEEEFLKGVGVCFAQRADWCDTANRFKGQPANDY